MCLSLPGERDRRKHRVDRRRLELVADRAAGRDVEKMVRVNCLRRAGKTVDPLGHQRRRYDRRMEKRSFADDAVGVGNFAAQEQRRSADRSACSDESLRAHRDAA